MNRVELDGKLKVGIGEWIKLGFGLYIGKELGKVFCEKCVPVIKERIKTMI